MSPEDFHKFLDIIVHHRGIIVADLFEVSQLLCDRDPDKYQTVVPLGVLHAWVVRFIEIFC